MMKVINFWGGPGARKSTNATALFSHLKDMGLNVEYVPEYAKDATWERRGVKFFAAQQHIYGEQSWRLERLVGDVDIAITDAPLPQGIVYANPNMKIPSLRRTIMEDFSRYENLNIYLSRPQVYNPKGRHQTLAESIILDEMIYNLLKEENVPFSTVFAGRGSLDSVLNVIKSSTNWLD